MLAVAIATPVLNYVCVFRYTGSQELFRKALHAAHTFIIVVIASSSFMLVYVIIPPSEFNVAKTLHN